MPDLDAAYRQAQQEILDDIASGRVPTSVTTFAELHDHVDANWYGGLFDLEIDPSDDEQVEFGNDLQNRLDAWLRAGRREASGKSIVAIPGTTVAHYEDGRITEIAFWPSASNAGYFGPAARLDEGDEDLDIEETDGPFWQAMQAHIAGGYKPVIMWRE
jgi:hypothetical protein